MNVYIGGAKDYSAMQGPCSSGFHVPLKSEWEAVNNAGISLGAWSSSNGSGLKTYLKMPYGGDRNRSNSNIEGQGSWGNYWASLADSSDTRLANCFAFDSTYTVVGGKYRTTGLSIRAFRNNPIVPDSSWTVLKQGTGTAGIYHNSTLGLISISSDGTTWYTLADKNLGATTVYNDGNTLSEANCGKYYQFGNNYGFAFTGSVTTSSSQVNAGSYGPGNYYSSSTFIIYSTGAWDNSGNNNLRGGVTGIVSPAELKNAYIGEVWTPGSNTLAYFPLAEDGLDKTGNYTLSNTGTAQTIGRRFTSQAGLNSTPSNPRTTSGWVKIASASASGGQCGVLGIGGSYICYGTDNSKVYNKSLYIYANANYYYSINLIDNQWHHIVITNNGSNIIGYVDGVKHSLGNPSIPNYGNNLVYKSGSNTIDVTISEFIIESRQWTDDEVTAYYNQTKSKYGL